MSKNICLAKNKFKFYRQSIFCPFRLIFLNLLYRADSGI